MKIKVTQWFKKYWFLTFILTVGAVLRLYKIDQYLTFLGDEGRDAIVVRNLLVHFDPILIGPGTSVGGMYLGPLYYYFMAPFLLLSNFSPIGPAVGVALLGVATIYLVYITGKAWFNSRVGLIAAILYAVAPTVIIYSRSSWNPNIMPFFALLAVYSVWKVYSAKKYNWLIVTAVSFAFVLQSHYLGLLLLPVLVFVWFLSVYNFRLLRNSRFEIRVFLKKSVLAFIIFLGLMSPLVLFDVRHDYLNSKALHKFLTVRQETVSIRPWTAVPKSYPIFETINTSLLTAKQASGQYITFVLVLWVFYHSFKSWKEREKHINFYILIVWIISAVIGFGVYKQHIYDHYFGFLFPAPFLLLATLADNRLSKGKIYDKSLVYVLLALLVGINLWFSPIFSAPNRQMQRSLAVAQKIQEESKDSKFNIAVIAERNYEAGYQYFLEKNNAKIVKIDAQIPDTVTDQLFVICEVNGSSLTKEKCDPTHSSKAEVANFGWSEIDMTWEVDGVIIYKLVHVAKSG